VARVLLLLPTATYRAADFLTAARALGAEVVVASERRLVSIGDAQLTLDLCRPEVAAEAIAAVAAESPLDAVVAVEVPHDELIRRLSGRLVCRSCGAMYHAASNPPEHAARCDRCGGDLYQREDDLPDRIAVRLALHAREVAPVEEFYRACGLLRAVQGTGTQDDVFGRIRASLP